MVINIPWLFWAGSQHHGDWHAQVGVGLFKTSQQSRETLQIGDPNQTAKFHLESRQ